MFDFLISQQETQHIFVNYRRHRQSFSVRVAANRALERYNEKMRDAIKGLGLMANVYKDFAIDLGYGYTDIWPYISGKYFRDNILASSVGFDFFTRQMGRPSSGLHFINWDKSENTARSALDTAGNPSFTVLTVPEGAYGIGAVASQAWGNVGFGGRLLENKLAPAYPTGEYRTDYTMNCGSYYDKAWTPMLMTESVDNFISDSRRDFVDPRYRSVSVADVFPEGYRRWLANSLTGDEALKAPRAYAVAVPNAGVNDMPRPVVEMPEALTGLTTLCLPDGSNNDVARCGAGNKCCANPNLSPPYNRGICITGTTCAATPKCGYEDNVTAANSDPPCADGMMCCQGLCTKGGCYIDASHGMGWVTYLPATGPEACFWSQGSLEQPLVDGAAKCSGDTGKKANSLPIDPQIGWEQQKFLIAMTLQYLPENQRVDWLNMMRVYEAGKDADPNIPIDSRIELHDPTGKIYMARTYGTESIFGTTVQKGIAARVLEYANDMLNKAYACTAVTHNGATWYEPNLDPQGQPLLLNDPAGGPASPCVSSAACMSYANYMSVPAFMRQVLATYYQGQTGMKGLY